MMGYDPLSIYLGKLIGIVMFILGFAFLTRRVNFQKSAEEISKSHAIMNIIAILPLIAGIAIVLSHNKWYMQWPVLITIVGWLLTLAGIFRIFFHNFIMNMLARVYNDKRKFIGVGIFMLVFGFFLLYMAFSTVA